MSEQCSSVFEAGGAGILHGEIGRHEELSQERDFSAQISTAQKWRDFEPGTQPVPWITGLCKLVFLHYLQLCPSVTAN